MKQLITEEGNKLIADFMEIPKCDMCKVCDKYKYGPCIYYSPGEMRYHNSWNWLMPVVKKIQQLKMQEWGKKKPIMDALIDVDIEILYQSVLVFVIWYNSITSNTDKI